MRDERIDQLMSASAAENAGLVALIVSACYTPDGSLVLEESSDVITVYEEKYAQVSDNAFYTLVSFAAALAHSWLGAGEQFQFDLAPELFRTERYSGSERIDPRPETVFTAAALPAAKQIIRAACHPDTENDGQYLFDLIEGIGATVPPGDRYELVRTIAMLMFGELAARSVAYNERAARV
jgi:hypothetical protein